MLRRFRLEEPETVREVSELLTRFGESAKVYAGGTELLLAMKEGLVQYERLINVKKLTGLNEVKLDNGTAHIGALCTHRQLETAPVLQQRLPALMKLEKNVANVRVRQVGTLGGNLCFAEPHADPGILLMALQRRWWRENLHPSRKLTLKRFSLIPTRPVWERMRCRRKFRYPCPRGKSGFAISKLVIWKDPVWGLPSRSR